MCPVWLLLPKTWAMPARPHGVAGSERHAQAIPQATERRELQSPGLLSASAFSSVALHLDRE